MSSKALKTKVLPPTLREHQRYLIYAVDYFTAGHTQTHDVQQAIHNTLLRFFGEAGMAEAGLQHVKGTSSKQLIRINRTSIDAVKTGLMTLTHIQQRPSTLRCVGVSGTITKAEDLYHDMR